MEIIYVKDVKRKKEGDNVYIDVLVKSLDVKTASNGSRYLDLTLADSEEEINAKIWSATEDTINFVRSNKYIRVKAQIDSYKGTLQLKVSRCGPIPESELDISKLQKTAPETVDDLVKELEDTIEMIDDLTIKTIVSRRYIKNKEKFIIWPAAKTHHHNYPTGLLYHTVSMLRLAKNNLRQYPNKLDKDVTLGAIILHDMDKVYEYSNADQPEYTEIGKLLGHVFLSGAQAFHEYELLVKENKEYKSDKVKYLIHAILAHHGKKEWGSPVEPQTIEAEIVHQIDMMDSRMNMTFKNK